MNKYMLNIIEAMDIYILLNIVKMIWEIIILKYVCLLSSII